LGTNNEYIYETIAADACVLVTADLTFNSLATVSVTFVFKL